MNKPSFDELPMEVAKINEKLEKVLEILNKQKVQEPDKLLTVRELMEYLPENPACQTIYGWVNNRIIPFQKHGKRLYFRKSIIDEWLNNGRQINI
jgi:hypothetical protein